jgi:carbamoyltransferase
MIRIKIFKLSKKKYNLDYVKVKKAKKLQEKSFEYTCALIDKALSYSNIKNIVLSGGYFLNCVNNFKYVKKYPQLNFFVDPVAHDGGTSIGAAIFYNDYYRY